MNEPAMWDADERPDRRTIPADEPVHDASQAQMAAYLQAILAHTPVVLLEVDHDGHILLAEGAAAPVLGERTDDLVGRSVHALLADVPDLASAWRDARAGIGADRRIEREGALVDLALVPSPVAQGRVLIIAHATDRAEATSREDDVRFRALMDKVRGIVFCHGLAGDGAYGYRDGRLELFGVDAREIMGVAAEDGTAAIAAWYAAIHPDDLPAYRERERRRKERHEPYTLDYRVRHPSSGEERWMREVAWAVEDVQAGCTWLDGYILDVTDEKRAEAALRESNERYRQLIEGAPVAILIYAEQRCIYANPVARTLLAASDASMLLGRRLDELMGAASRQQREEAATALVASASAGPREVLCRRIDGQRVWVEISAAEIVQGGAPALQLVLVDLTARKRAEATMRRIAHHDPLTGLPNRLVLMDRLSQAIARARRDGDRLALMILDLDGFKEVNDMLGHAAGDELLCQVARRVRQAMRASDTLARLGGDEFAVIQLALRNPRDAAALADKIVETLAEPFVIDGQEVSAPTSIGISIYPDDGTSPGTLLKNADLALYRAKDAGRSRACFFAPELDAAAQSRRLLAIDLKAAFERGELMLAYQPQLEIGSRRIVAAEALLRWSDPERGDVPPATFLRVAEGSGLIRALGAWVVDAVCAQARRWDEMGVGIEVAMNVSAAQLRDPGFPVLVASALERYGLAPGRLCLELTESALTAPVLHDAAAMIGRLADLGVRIAIDDFGTGFSSLLNLKHLPVWQIKIDQSFVHGIETDPESEAIIRATIGLAHSLGKQVVAEGVETEVQHRRLKGLGCDRGQGFLYAHPIAADDLSGRLR